MTTFATPVPAATALRAITPSAPVPTDPALRFSGDNIQWIGLPPGTQISAFATGSVSRASGASNGIPGQPAAAWTAFQLSPWPQMDPTAFKRVLPGLPLQIVLVIGLVATPDTDTALDAGALLTTAPAAGPDPTAFLGFIFQDRLMRDPFSAAKAIAASNACDANWTAYMASLAGLPNGRTLRVLDHVGQPMSGITVTVAINGGPAQSVALTPAMDGDSGIAVPDGAIAAVSVPAWPNAIVAGEADIGSFQTPLTLAPGEHLVQVLNPDNWFAQPDPGVSLPIWWPNSHIEPIQDGTPYFTRLVSDMRAAKNGGKVQVAGWAVVKGSQADSTVDWPLIPGDATTTIMALVNELRSNDADIRILLNRFLQFDSPTIDDFPELAIILLAFYAALAPLSVFAKMATDPAGYVVGFLAVAALETLLLETSALEDLVASKLEFSQDLKNALDKIDPTIATWTPYPATFADNPLVTPPPFQILHHTIDDLSHIGVYHQKLVTIVQADGTRLAYLGGIDINCDRPDTPLHRAKHPFHDLQVCITGPAVQALFQTYAERANVKLYNAPTPVDPTKPVPSPAGASHLVQIARTYYKPATPPSLFKDFAPYGESTPIRTVKSAMAQAKDYIWIEDQYFTPPEDYIEALLAAADNNNGSVRALVLMVNFATDQPYGSIRREAVLAALKAKWGTRLHLGAPLRRFSHEVPGLTTNLGRLALTAKLDKSALTATMGPPGRVPAPPFWAFIGNELVLVYALAGAATASDQGLEIWRAAAGSGGWGAQPVEHLVGTPVLAVQLPPIYVHPKMMIVDDVFLFAGSSNVNRRGFYHDGELDSFTVPQHLIGDPRNPARTLRARLMSEHLGLGAEMGQALFADPHSAFAYFAARTWYEQSHWQSLDFFGSLPPDIPLGTAGSIPKFLFEVAKFTAQAAAKTDVWTLLADPTTSLDPNPTLKGPDYP